MNYYGPSKRQKVQFCAMAYLDEINVFSKIVYQTLVAAFTKFKSFTQKKKHIVFNAK